VQDLPTDYGIKDDIPIMLIEEAKAFDENV
jgi:uncharacterized protein YbaR (Trm112 family)